MKVNRNITMRKGIEGGVDGAASAAAVVAAWQIGKWLGADLPEDVKAYLVLAVSSIVTGAVRAMRNWIKIRGKKD